jgi:hypothetical protein
MEIYLGPLGQMALFPLPNMVSKMSDSRWKYASGSREIIFLNQQFPI